MTQPPTAAATTEPPSPAEREATAEPAATAEPTPSPTPTPAIPAGSGVEVPEVATRSARLEDLPTRVVSAPVSMAIPGIGVDAEVVPVGVVPETAELDVPPTAATVAWYEHGPSPGDPGSAVLAGHVDYAGTPGVFFRLGELEVGATVVVRYDDGSERTFEVTDRRQFAKAELPTAELFARDGEPRLVLITCGGSFDRAARSYRDNVVVTALPVG